MQSVRVLTAVLVVFAASFSVAQSDAQKTFDTLKTLAGSWEGKASNGQTVRVDYRVTSRGSALMSEILGDEDMISMFHLDNDRVLMTHYCAAGNQPRMQATVSPDGKTITFEFVDGTNIASPQAGHMQRMILTMLDTKHHTEDWTFVQDGKEMHEKFDLQRKS